MMLNKDVVMLTFYVVLIYIMKLHLDFTLIVTLPDFAVSWSKSLECEISSKRPAFSVGVALW